MLDVPLYERAGSTTPRSGQRYIIHDVLEETRNHLITMASEKRNYRVEVRHGNVVDELLAEIERYKPGLVVICTHGWTGMKHLLLGSIAEKLVRLSPAPVLSFRGDAE